MPWTRTLRGWFGLLLIELTIFTGWLITEVQLVTFLTQFNKAADIVRGLLHPSSSILHQGLVLLVQTVFLAFMATTGSLANFGVFGVTPSQCVDVLRKMPASA